MPLFAVIGALAAIAFLLWRVTSGIARRGSARKSDLLHHENIELRHVVTEMAMERHQSRAPGRHK